MHPKEFEEANDAFAKNQPEYKPLPVHIIEDGKVVSCWEFTDEEIEKIKQTKCLYLTMMPFGQPLQPVYITVEKDEVIAKQNKPNEANASSVKQN
ncbi:hypothetical protein [Elizabethkingia anophelis]|uniref:hypothetical protein n=1 Tax=Elizabethkingia anophelis TaxID=1117645 RepID=UPI002406AC0C|nr:hypothetical protein [Elizabethkingia anophelis]